MEERRSKAPTFVQKIRKMQKNEEKRRKMLKDGKSITKLEMSVISEQSGEQKLDTIMDGKPSPKQVLDWEHPFWQDPNEPRVPLPNQQPPGIILRPSSPIYITQPLSSDPITAFFEVERGNPLILEKM